MKKINYLLFTFLFLGILSSCRDDLPQQNVRPAYNYYQEIVNPPDDFIIAFDNTSVGQKVARVTFDSVGVWVIDRIGDARQSIVLKNNTNSYPINLIDSIGLTSDSEYQVVVNSVLYGESRNLYVGFKRLNMDYSAFEPKF